MKIIATAITQQSTEKICKKFCFPKYIWLNTFPNIEIMRIK